MSITSRFEYEVARGLEAEDTPFFALIQAAMRRADTFNLIKLQDAFPGVWEEMLERYNTPGGHLKEEMQG